MSSAIPSTDLQQITKPYYPDSTAQFGDHEVVVIPPSAHGERAEICGAAGAGIGAIITPTCCGAGLLLVTVGGIMWGICSDPTKSGCNEAILDAGKVLTSIGITAIGSVCCFFSCLACAACKNS